MVPEEKVVAGDGPVRSKSRTAPLNTPPPPPRPLAVTPLSHRGFAIRLAELVILMSAIIGALALGLGLIDYLSENRYVAAYLSAYAIFRLADLLVRDEAALGLDRERFARRVMFELPLLLLFFAAPFERTYIYGGDAPRWLSVLGLLIELVGLWLVLGARIQLGFFAPGRSEDSDGVLVRSGLYRFIRHPIYAGEFIVLFAWPFLYGAPITLIVASGIGIFVMRGRIRSEEAALLAQFGDEYTRYIAVTDRVVPNIW